MLLFKRGGFGDTKADDEEAPEDMDEHRENEKD
jgi:hypothetical protein